MRDQGHDLMQKITSANQQKAVEIEVDATSAASEIWKPSSAA
jgi:hypothetical protein